MESQVFLQTKMHPSQVAFRSLTRARLIRELDREQQVRLVLVTGPAGSGKSTLLADYVSQRPRKGAWLGLGEEDLDPQVFLNYFLEALCQAYPGSVEQTRNRYGTIADSMENPDLGPFFINELVDYGEPVAIVLDDFHLVDPQPTINAFFKLLVKRGPTNLTILLASRDLPDLPLPWLRAKRLMTEIHQENLRFTVPETAELFRDVWGQPLEEDLVRVLVERTEGWATGLQLVAQAVRSRSSAEVRRYIQELQGAESNIYEYLATEVFEAQPPKVQEFLKFTAIPDHFNPPLSQELVAGSDSIDMIDYLKTARLFLVQVDRDGEWFRYHHLFRDFLRSKLRKEHGKNVLQTLHRQTATWLYQHDDVVSSIPHFLSSGDPELAAEVLEKVGSDLLHRGLRTSVTRWLESLPDSLRHSRPGLIVLQGELFDLLGQWPRAVEHYQIALQEYRTTGQTRELASVLEKLSLCYLKYGESKHLLETCEEGLRLCPEENRSLRALLESWLGGCLINSGEDWDRGYQLIRSSHFLAFESADPRAISWASMTYGFVYHFPQGNYEEALRTLNEGIDFFTRLGWPMVLYQLAMNKALVQIVQGDPASATALVDETLVQAKRAGHTYVEKGLENLRGMCYLESRRLSDCRHTLANIAQTEIPAQFKPWFFRNRMLLNCLEQNFGQARVDAEEMERSLLLNGSGMYAPECFASLAFLLIESGDVPEAQHRLQMNLRLCEKAHAKFWGMKTQSLLALTYLQQKDTVKFRSSLEKALQTTQANDYAMYWMNDPWNLSVPLLVAGLAYGVETAVAERLLARMSSRWAESMEEVVQSSDPAIRTVAISYLARSSKENVKSLLKALYKNDPEASVREAAKKSLKLPENGSRLQITCLGPLRIGMEGENFDYARSMRPMAQKLLKFFLANADRVLASDKILEKFWPEVDPDKGRHSLATQLSTIRRSLGCQMLFPRLGDGYRLCLNGEVVLDVQEFERCIRVGMELFRSGESEDAVASLTRAEYLYQGDFLSEDLYEDWVDWRRRELREQYEEALETLGDHFSKQGANDQALARYRKLLVSEEPQERVFHKVFRCYEVLGDRQGARREYESFRARLKESLGLEPQPATRALIEALFLRE